MTNQITHPGAHRKIWPPDEWTMVDYACTADFTHSMVQKLDYQSMTNKSHTRAYRKIWPPDEWIPPDDVNYPARTTFHAFHGAETVIRTE